MQTLTAESKSTQLQEWAKTNEPAGTLIYREGYWDQIMFVRDKMAGVLAPKFEDYQNIQTGMRVISTHTSKSVRLPVFKVELADGTVFVMRYNFHDWKVLVDSPRDVDADFMGLFNPSQRISSVYCEGFPKEYVYGPYAESKRQFTIELPAGHYYLFTFFWIFARVVLGNRNGGGSGK